MTVLDVGAGAGRYARTLARHVAAIVAVEPNPTMTALLEQAAAEEGLRNVRIVAQTWQEADVEPADVVLCAHVLYPVADARSFIEKLNDHARAACFLALRETAPEPELLARLWQAYHGEPRALQPGFVDAYNLLHEMGIYANVRIVPSRRSLFSFEDLDHAVSAIREHLILPDDPAIDARLRAELEPVLVRDGDQLSLPHDAPPAAIIWWEKPAA